VARLGAAAGAVLLVAPGLTACAGPGPEGTLTVLAAASLSDAFGELGSAFEETHPEVEVAFSFGSSTVLAEQVVDGAPGDVLATADPVAMAIAQDADALAADPVRFASNAIVLVVPAANPAGITALADLDGTRWVRCADEAPCGRATAQLLGAHDPVGEPASLEEDVRSTLEKVVSAEVDAGFVYASDAMAAGEAVTTVAVPGTDGADGAANAYLIAPLPGDHGELARAWLDLVTGPEGAAVLARNGFSPP